MQDFFHYNRVEGPYLGGKIDYTIIADKLKSSTKVGYAFDAELWQHEYSLTYMLNKKHRFDFQTLYHGTL